MQASDVKRLGGRAQRNTVALVLLANGGKRHKRVSGHHQFAMDLVANDAHMVFRTNGPHAAQLLSRPHPSGRIMRVAKQENGYFLVLALALKVVPIHNITVALSFERTFGNAAALVANGRKEAVVNGSHHKHLLAGERQGLDGTTGGGHHTRGVENRRAIDRPLMASLLPRDNGIVIAIVDLGIAKNAMVHTSPKRFLDSGRCLKIHVSHPQGQHLVIGKVIPLDGTTVPTVDDLRKVVVFHYLSPIWHSRDLANSL